ncbi:MAG TPA: Lrp/AsnC family transcriptional regulator [Clostridiales bacterium]|jgi:DNA-binding Lrp family transcriptional regulator|nr:Lrp/AsnC family transcriptional regulator [Clostridiales bacterium]
MDYDKLLWIIEQDSRLSAAQLAGMLGGTKEEVETKIKEFEENKTILGYKTIVDWDKTDREIVTALIEVKVVPQRGEGFDRVAARIYQFPEVDSVYLMSGGFDLMVLIEGKTMKEVALFVAQKLAVLDSVSATSTHFVLKKYKDKGVVFDEEKMEDKRTPMV